MRLAETLKGERASRTALSEPAREKKALLLGGYTRTSTPGIGIADLSVKQHTRT